MAPEPVVVRSEDGKTSTVQAEVVRYSNAERITKASLFVIAGLIGGTVCIIVPVLHLITTWGFPLIGILLALRTMKREMSILQPQGPCPSCGQPLDMAGGAMIDKEWQMCPHCKAKLTFAVNPPPTPATNSPNPEETV